MAYSYTDYSGTGALTQFAVPFPYLDKSHVSATVGGIYAAFTWLNDTTIVFNAAPAVGTNNTRIIRITPIATLRQTFVDGSTLTQDQLNQQNKQTLYALQEDADSFALSKPLPAPVANYLIGWDPSGTTLVTVAPGSVALAIPASGSVDQSKLAVDVQYQVDTIAALKSLTTKYNTVLVRGYYAVGDGGGGLFRWNSVDVTADNLGTIIIPGAGGVGRWNRIVSEGPSYFNVRWFGAKGDLSNDDTAAIQSAADTLPSGQLTGTLFLPNGHYKVTSAITISAKGAVIRGEGRNSTSIRPSTNGAYWVFDLDATSISGNSFDIRDLSIRENGSMNLVSAVRVKNCYGPRIRNVNIDIGGKCIWVENCNDINISDIVATSQAGETVLRLKAVSGCVTNFNGHEATNTTFGSGGRDEKGPCYWLSGLTTSLLTSNSHFQGGGSREKFTLTSINSTPTQFVITLPTSHTLKAMERVFIDGCAVAAYNGTWKIESVTATTITVLTTLNPGFASSGIAGRMRCCLYIDSSDGPVNECLWSNVLFEGWYTAQEIGTASIYLDGLNAPTANGILNHTFAGCYYDYGQTAIHLQGKVFGGIDWSVRGIVISGGVAQYAFKGAYITGARNTLITGLQTSCQYNRATTSDQPDATGLHIDAAGTGAEVMNRVRITGCDFAPSVFGGTTFDQRYGVWLAGTTWDEVYFSGTHFFGATAATRLTDGASLAAKVTTIESCSVGDGATMTTADIVPSVASAATITIPWTPTINLTGVTTIDTINGGWPGRTCAFTIVTGLTISAAGNVKNGGAAIAADSIRIATYDGSFWRIR